MWLLVPFTLFIFFKKYRMFLFICLFIYFFAVLGLCCCMGFSLVAESGGYSPVAMHWLLTGGFSCCGAWVQYLQLPGSRAQAQ